MYLLKNLSQQKKNSHLLEKDIYITILLGNFYTENGLYQKSIEILQQGIKSIIMLLRYRYIEPNPPLEPEEEEDEKNIWQQRRFQRSVKIIISFLYSFAYTYEKVWKIEHAFEALSLARYLGKHVLFDNSDEFKRHLIHIEHELESKYSKIVQETLEIESIVTKELQKNRKWYQISEMLKEEKQREKEKKNMYDEELYEKNNIKKLNLSKTIAIKKKEEDSFKNFLSTISLKKQSSEGDKVLNSRSRGGSGDKIQTVFKRDRATTFNSQQTNEMNQSDSKFSTPFSKMNTENDDRIPTPMSLQMQRISEKRSNQSSQSSFDKQIQRNGNYHLSYSLREGYVNRMQTKYSKSIFSGSNNNNNNKSCPRFIKFNQSLINNSSGNQNLLSITNILNNQSNKSFQSISNFKNLNNSTQNYEGSQLLKSNQDMTDREILINNQTNQSGGYNVDVGQNQEKTPSDQKKLQSSQSLTYNNSGIQNSSLQGTNIPINVVNAYQNNNDSNQNILSAYKSNGGDSVNSFRSVRKYQVTPSIFCNRSGFRFGTPQRYKSSSGQNSKGSYHINYGRMSIRINDIENPENFGALTNLLLSDNLEKLEENPNVKEGNSHFMFESPSSTSSASPKQKDTQQNMPDIKQFKSKTKNTITSSSIPFNSSTKTGDDKSSYQNGENQKTEGSQSEIKPNFFNEQKTIYGQSSDMTNFDTQNLDKKNKDVTNLDYYLSQHIYKALQKSFTSKAYSKIKSDVDQWKRKDDLQKKNLVFGKKMLKFRMKEDLLRPESRKLDNSAMKNLSSYRQVVNLNAEQDTSIIEIQDSLNIHKQDREDKKNQIKQRLNETRDSSSQISDFDEDQNEITFITNKKETFREIILKHKRVFPLIRVRKLLKERKKVMMKKQQQEILKNRIRQSITGNKNDDLFAFVQMKKLETQNTEIKSPEPHRVRFTNFPTDLLEDAVKEDPELLKEQNIINIEAQKHYLKNKELLHNMIENYETEKEKEMRGKNCKRRRVFSSDTAILQNRNTKNNLGIFDKPQKLDFFQKNRDLALSTSLLHAAQTTSQECNTFLSIVNLQQISKTRQTIKERITKVEVE